MTDSPTEGPSLGVLGAGAWGTALALTAARAGQRVILWAREPEVVEAVRKTRENHLFLPGLAIPETVAVTDDLAKATAAEAILAVTPAQHLRAVLTAMRPNLRPRTPVILCAKGIEQTTARLVTEVLTETLPEAVPGMLSGPSFAEDVARGLPTAVTLACADPAYGSTLAQRLSAPGFRPYWSADLTGVAIGGAVKNVLAIACGIAHGKRLGDSARAALITRGFAEMTRLGLALGARVETLAGLSGLGDLVLTCSSMQSRNFTLGHALGEGKTASEALAGKRSVAEGALTAPALMQRAREAKVEMPICEAVDAILAGRARVDDAIANLLARPLKGEH